MAPGSGHASGLAFRVLVTASSRYGATTGIARAIGEELARRDIIAVVQAPEDVGCVDGYQAVILGSAVYGGHWLAPAMDLADRCAAALAARPVWLFSSGPAGDPARRAAWPMGEDPADLPALLAATGARGHRMFAGKLDRHNLGLTERALILLRRQAEGDFRDWTAIRAWAADIAGQLTAPGAAQATR